MKNEEIIQVLQTSKFFGNLSLEDIQRVASLCRTATYKAGECVFKQGDNCEYLCIIVEGQIYLERSMTVGSRKGRILIDTLGKGRTLGCWSALLGESHVLMSSAICQKQTTILIITGRDLRQMMEEKTGFGFHIMERLCFLLRNRIQAAYGAMDRI